MTAPAVFTRLCRDPRSVFENKGFPYPLRARGPPNTKRPLERPLRKSPRSMSYQSSLCEVADPRAFFVAMKVGTQCR